MIPIRQIHQIEITSRCNLRCRYCVHPTMKRAKEDMTDEIFIKSVQWAAYFKSKGTQGELNIAGIGESTMHPRFIDYLALARGALGEDHRIVMATNGLLVNDEMAQAMRPFRPLVWVSLHRPERAGPAVEALKRAGLFAGVSSDPSTAAVDWAGQVKWHVSTHPNQVCPWIQGGWAMVMSDGRITRCCFDGTGVGVFAHINDDLRKHETSPYSLCATCHMKVVLPMPEAAVA